MEFLVVGKIASKHFGFYYFVHIHNISTHICNVFGIFLFGMKRLRVGRGLYCCWREPLNVGSMNWRSLYLSEYFNGFLNGFGFFGLGLSIKIGGGAGGYGLVGLYG